MFVIPTKKRKFLKRGISVRWLSWPTDLSLNNYLKGIGPLSYQVAYQNYCILAMLVIAPAMSRKLFTWKQHFDSVNAVSCKMNPTCTGRIRAMDFSGVQWKMYIHVCQRQIEFLEPISRLLPIRTLPAFYMLLLYYIVKKFSSLLLLLSCQEENRGKTKHTLWQEVLQFSAAPMNVANHNDSAFSNALTEKHSVYCRRQLISCYKVKLSTLIDLSGWVAAITILEITSRCPSFACHPISCPNITATCRQYCKAPKVRGGTQPVARYGYGKSRIDKYFKFCFVLIWIGSYDTNLRCWVYLWTDGQVLPQSQNRIESAAS